MLCRNTASMADLVTRPPDDDPEFALCVACCRWPQDERASVAVLANAQAVDWVRMARMARRHRIEGLVYRGLSQAGVAMPAAVKGPLAAAARGAALQDMAMAAECVAIHQDFVRASIPLLFVKGVTIASLAYGELGLKRSLDIDLLVAASDLERAACAIEARGYRLFIPAEGRRQLGKWHRHSKESVWVHESRRQIDLHTSLVDHPALLRGVDVHAPVQYVPIGSGHQLPTLADADLFAYLAVHGASSGWFRLKWIADFVALYGSADSARLTALHDNGQAIGAGRATALAILLADALFGLALPPRLRNRLRSDQAVSYMLSQCLLLLGGRRALDEITHIRFGTVPIYRIQLALLPSWRYRAATLKGWLAVRLFGLLSKRQRRTKQTTGV